MVKDGPERLALDSPEQGLGEPDLVIREEHELLEERRPDFVIAGAVIDAAAQSIDDGVEPAEGVEVALPMRCGVFWAE